MTLTGFVKPVWLRKPVSQSVGKQAVLQVLVDKGVHTVCQGARCPNLSECFGRGTAAFLILGPACTRRCTFCAVDKGPVQEVRPEEPAALAAAAADMGLTHVVVTSVTRDDLPDGGADHFAKTVLALRCALPTATVEVLTPDFLGQESSLLCVLEARPDIFNHNLETVPRLYGVRPGADFNRSLGLLRLAKEHSPRVQTKSGLMLGMGETPEEVFQVLKCLAAVGCDKVTLGQYLSPSRHHHAVADYVTPDQFDDYRIAAEGFGITQVFSGPFVRSSYRAEEMISHSTPTLTRSLS